MEWRVIVWLIIIGLVIGWLFTTFVRDERISTSLNIFGAIGGSLVGGSIFYFMDLGGEFLLAGITSLLVIFVIYVFKQAD